MHWKALIKNSRGKKEDRNPVNSKMADAGDVFMTPSLICFQFQQLNEKSKSITGVHQWPYRAVAKALEVIPRTLIQNCGANTIRTITALRVNL